VKTLKDFISTKEEPLPNVVEESVEPEILEVEELPSFVVEDKKTEKHDPPAVLMMRRVGIRQYPNKQKVALYYVDKIHKYVTVPYDKSQMGSTVSEESEVSVIEKLKWIVENKTSLIIDSKQISLVQAKSVLNAYSKLNENNKEKLEVMAESNITEAIEFARRLLK
jgi:hypothetical protein